MPIETAGLEADATLIDVDTLTALLAGTTNEQTTMGRKTLTDADLVAIIPLTMFDFTATPSGTDIQMTTGVFFRAA